MKEGWVKKRLQDVCEKITDGTHQTPKYFDTGVIFLSSKNVTSGKIDWDNVKYIDEAQHLEMHKRVAPKRNDILLAKNGTTGVAAMVDRDEIFDIYVSLAHIRVKDEVLPEFMLHFINSPLAKSQFNSRLKGIGVPNLHLQEIREVEISFPVSKLEQKQIVAILDEAFVAIERAKANIEKNIQNAKELFQSKLNEIFTLDADGWEQKRLQDIALEFGRGKSKHRPRNDIKLFGGNFPFVQTGDVRNVDKFITSYSQTYNEIGLKQSKLWPKGTICITIAANIAETAILDFEGCFPDSIIGLVVDENIANRDYAFYALQFMKAELQAQGKGSAQDNINLGTFQNQHFPFPSIEIQVKMVDILDKLKDQCNLLEDSFFKKSLNLDDLKKSVLQKAFAGELASTDSVTSIIEKAQPLSPQLLEKIAGISPTDLQAGITAYALSKHIESNQTDSFHHVKAEKIVHLAEYAMGIDLDRNPVKDAAGPNDFRHAKKIESRARKAGFYTVTKQADIYKYSMGGQAQKLIDKTMTALGDKTDKLNGLLDLLLPMNTKQAEIVATVYAAWNNLLIQDQPISDETIVLEARENWHKNKLKIERGKFFNAIEWMRKHEILIPKGNGKMVTAK